MTRAVAIVMVALSLVVAACGNGDTQETRRPRDTAPITTTNPPPFDGTVLQVPHEFWHSGFHVELTRAEVSTSRTMWTSVTSYWLTLWGDFENQGGDVASFDPEMAIVGSGVSYSKRRGTPPRILPESSARGYISFLIPEDLDLESVELVIGKADESQARIPLSPRGTAVSLAPADVPIRGQLATELIDLDFTGASLRYDVPDLHRQLEMGMRALTLNFDVTSRIAADGRISSDDITLVLPDGSIIVPTVAELGQVTGGDDGGAVTPDRFVSFVVDEMPTGDFTLRLALDDRFVSEDGITEATFDFGL